MNKNLTTKILQVCMIGSLFLSLIISQKVILSDNQYRAVKIIKKRVIFEYQPFKFNKDNFYLCSNARNKIGLSYTNDQEIFIMFPSTLGEPLGLDPLMLYVGYGAPLNFFEIDNDSNAEVNIFGIDNALDYLNNNSQFNNSFDKQLSSLLKSHNHQMMFFESSQISTFNKIFDNQDLLAGMDPKEYSFDRLIQNLKLKRFSFDTMIDGIGLRINDIVDRLVQKCNNRLIFSSVIDQFVSVSDIPV